MRTEYKRDMNHNYLVIYGEEEIDTSAYQVRMLVGNIIPSLLKCRIQGMDGNFVVYYDITSRQSLVTFYENKKFRQEDLRLIFGEFIRVMEDMTEYLMNPGQLVLLPEYLFLEVEKREIYFCLMPGYRKEVREQFQALTEYILPKIDHEDGAAVALGYGVYRRALEDSFHLENIKEELYRVREDKNGKKYKGDEADSPTIGTQADSAADDMTGADLFAAADDLFEGREAYRKEALHRKKTSVWKTVLGFGSGILILAGLTLAKMLGYLPDVGVEVLLGSVLVGMGAGMLVYLIVKKRNAWKKAEAVLKKEGRSGKIMHGSKWEKEEKPERISKREREEKPERISKRERGEKPERISQWNRGENTEWISEWDKEKQPERGLESKGMESSGWGLYGRGENLRDFDEGKSKREEIPEVPLQGNCGETVVLSLNPMAGPASLVSREPGELATIYLGEELTVIGKLKNASDAVIDLPTVSRIHAKIRKREEDYYLTDLNSRNGTSVNGRLLRPDEEYCLQNEDEVDFAQARYIFLR